MDEQELIQWIIRRDPQGMDALLTHYGPLMRYIIAPILPDVRDREECLQEAAMRVWERIEQFDSQRGSWNAWLTAVTRNTALNHVRVVQSGSETLTEEVPSPEPTPEETLLLRERQAELSLALKQLSPAERMLFYRKYYYRQSTAQIASELGLTVRAVEGRLYRIKRQLRERLGGVYRG